MKTELEHINPAKGSSVSLMINPNLSDFFFWHFHPEFELVYIEGADGNRHVGKHHSVFKGSDLVLIGSYIPHLNFDYGIKSTYEKIVVHIQPDFLKGTFADTPELSNIHNLLQLSQHGIAFGSETKKELGPRLKKLENRDGFDLFLELLDILNILSSAKDSVLLHQEIVRNQFNSKDKDRLDKIYSFIELNYRKQIKLEEVAELSHLTKPAFCRYFKHMTKLTFTQFVNHYRVDQAKKLLLSGSNVTEACFSSGFESLSYFNRTFKKITGTNPVSFRSRYQNR
ncbi:helix-turn-helix domain-containing protein [Lutimonas zeaxanthinifaciens]|uniref:helix-turn-helix domain-containing protein n=1 Tax=Lutimonas zeaxanthinifaciens TaxID=3060215 RepID=UPI00265D4704|nr:AraC family transcriptional regulator [Lutimonas sp. YSD2104]WKK66331.1 AraC family transcriptional regulator [Lutimonas sp. YSD2104]